MRNCRVFPPAKLVGKRPSIVGPAGSGTIQPVIGRGGAVIHCNFIVMGQRSARVIVGRLRQIQGHGGETFRESGLWIIFLSVTRDFRRGG